MGFQNFLKTNVRYSNFCGKVAHWSRPRKLLKRIRRNIKVVLAVPHDVSLLLTCSDGGGYLFNTLMRSLASRHDSLSVRRLANIGSRIDRANLAKRSSSLANCSREIRRQRVYWKVANFYAKQNSLEFLFRGMGFDRVGLIRVVS